MLGYIFCDVATPSCEPLADFWDWSRYQRDLQWGLAFSLPLPRVDALGARMFSPLRGCFRGLVFSLPSPRPVVLGHTGEAPRPAPVLPGPPRSSPVPGPGPVRSGPGRSRPRSSPVAGPGPGPPCRRSRPAPILPDRRSRPVLPGPPPVQGRKRNEHEDENETKP